MEIKKVTTKTEAVHVTDNARYDVTYNTNADMLDSVQATAHDKESGQYLGTFNHQNGTTNGSVQGDADFATLAADFAAIIAELKGAGE